MTLGRQIAAIAVLLSGCGGDDSSHPVDVVDSGMPTPPGELMAQGVAVLGSLSSSVDQVEVVEIELEARLLRGPRDLAFMPSRPNELWIVNRDDSSTVVVMNPATPEQTAKKYKGPGNTHFMASVSALAFGTPDRFATIHDTDERTEPGTPEDFMGPTLWTTDLGEFDSGHIGHYDMLHNSPNGVGIAWDYDNVYWVFDGYHKAITRYDFVMDHGSAGEDHSDGIVQRYVDGQMSYVDGVSSHIELDPFTNLLYIADTGNSRIAVLDTTTGTPGRAITPNHDGTEQHMMDGAELRTLVDGNAPGIGMPRPSGLALHDGLVFVSDNDTSAVLAFEMETGQMVDWLDLSSKIEAGGLMGIAFDAEGRLYVVDAVGAKVYRIAPLAR